jgi:hypothetical protein
MKKLLFLLAAGITIGTFSCKKEAIQPNSTGQSDAGAAGGGGPTTKTVPYIWKINSFVVNGTDMTAQFADYRFDIRAPQLMIENGIIVAVSGSGTYNGKWNRVAYNEVVITYPVDPSNILSQLNDDWILTNNLEHDIAMQTSSKKMSFHNDGETWPEK